MRSLLPLVVLLGTTPACSFPYGSVERTDVPMPDVPVVGCNVVDQTGCSGGACQADIDGIGLVETQCHPSGSSSSGGYCVDHSFCGNGLACWANRDGAPDGTCYAVCFTSATCPFGTHCDSSTPLTATYLGRAAYPCLPD